jgi:hypothetical protein
MKPLAVSAGAVILSLGCASLDDSADWIDIKEPGELRALFSNKVMSGRTWYGYTFSGRYWADGEGEFHPPHGSPVHLYWEVVGNDKVCFTPTTLRTVCHYYARHRTHANVHRAFKSPSDRSEYDELWVKSFEPDSPALGRKPATTQ